MPKRSSYSKSSKALIPKKFLLPVFVGLLLVVGLVVALILGATNQDNRQQAFVAAPPACTGTCHYTSGGTCHQLTCPAGALPAGYSCGGCPMPACTQTHPGTCRDSQGSNCGAVARQGVQDIICNATGATVSQQYCTIPACGAPASAAPTAVPITTTCNNSTGTIQQDCRYKKKNDACVFNGKSGVCTINNPQGDCSCNTQYGEAVLPCVTSAGFPSGSCADGKTYPGQACTTNAKTAGTCVQAGQQGATPPYYPLCNCVPTIVQPIKNELKCSSTLPDQGSCAGQMVGTACGISTKSTGTCFVNGTTSDSTGSKCKCMAGQAPTPTVCSSGSTTCVGKILNGDCGVSGNSSSDGMCLSGGNYDGKQRCTCTPKSTESTKRCSDFGPYSGQCNGAAVGSVCNDGRDTGTIHSCVQASTRDPGSGRLDCTCSGTKPPGVW